MDLNIASQIAIGVFLFVFGFGFRWIFGVNRRVQSNEADIKMLRAEGENRLELVTQGLQNSINNLTKATERLDKSMEWIISTLQSHEQQFASIRHRK